MGRRLWSRLTIFYSAVLIAIYRPYLAATAHTLQSTEAQSVGAQAEKAAAETTAVLNDLISMNLTHLCTSQFITSSHCAVQIYFWKIRHATGLARQYAHNQLDLYMLALSEFRKTYWVADLQHKMFAEGLKALEGKSSIFRSSASGAGGTQQQGKNMVQDAGGVAAPLTYTDHQVHTALEDFLIAFNPFMGMPLNEDLRLVVRT